MHRLSRGERGEPALVWCPHPLLAAAGREVRYEQFEAGESIAGYLDRLGYAVGDRDFILTLNGGLVPREEWALTFPRAGDLIAVRARVRGADGDAGGKNPLVTILSIALIIVAPYAGAGLSAGLAEAGIAISEGTAASLIVVGGSLLINALLPPSQDNLANAQRAAGLSGAGTYSLAGGSNRARPYGPLTRVLGSVRVYPDLGSKTFTEFRGQDQYLLQVFHFGISDENATVELSAFRIGDTPIESFQDVQVQVSGADGKLTLFPQNVDTVEGGTMTVAAGWVTRTTPENTTAITIEISALLFEINTTTPGVAVPFADLETLPAKVELLGEYRPVGAEVWTPIFDGTRITYAPAYWSMGRYYQGGALEVQGDLPIGAWIQHTYGTTNALEHRDGDFGTTVFFPEGSLLDQVTYFWRWRPYAEINGGVDGGALSAPAPEQGTFERTQLIQLVSKSRSPLRYSTTLSVPIGQYEVRLQRITPDSTSTKLVNQVVWSQMRSFLPEATSGYEGQLRVAVAIKASGQLQGTLDRFNALATTRVWVHNGTTFVRDVSSNPAWLMFAALRGGHINGRRTWGAKVADARIDLPAIQAFAAWCDAKQLTFNAVFDQQMNCLEMLNAIALAGRGSVSMANGKFGVVWDAPNQPVMQVFGLGNIKADTFSVRWISEKLGDEIVLNYWDAAKNEQVPVRALVPGVTAPANPVQVERFGVDNADQAQREANLIAAAQKYRRRFVQFEADYEGQVIARGDVVALSHDLFASTQLNAWGYSGRLIAGTTTVLTLDRTVVMSATETNYCAVRFPDGQMYVRPVVYASGTPGTLTLATALPSAPDSDTLNPVVDYVWLFGLDAAGAAKKFKVQDVRPLDDKDVQITLVDENPLYYAAEQNPGTLAQPQTVLPQLPSITAISFDEALVRVGSGFGAKVSINWSTAGVYDHADVRVTVDGVLVSDTSVNGTTLELTVAGDAALSVTILPVHPIFGAGERATATHTVTVLSQALPNVPWIAVDGDKVTFGAVSYLALAGYQIRMHYGVNTDWGQAAPLHSGLLTDSPLPERLQFEGVVTLLVKAVSFAGTESAAAAYTVVALAGPPTSIETGLRNLRFEGWHGEYIGGTLISNRPNANSANGQLWNPNDTALMWTYDSAAMWPADTWTEMSYLVTLEMTAQYRGATMRLEPTIEGSAYRIEYRRLGNHRMWSADGELMWASDALTPMWAPQEPEGIIPRNMWTADADLMWDTLSATPMWQTHDGGFAAWPGVLPVENAEYQFRVTTAFGPVRGRIVELLVKTYGQVETETFTNVAIDVAGTRLPITRDYAEIIAVSGAAYSGSTAISFTVEEISAGLGPLIMTRDATGTPVAGTFTGFIQGILL